MAQLPRGIAPELLISQVRNTMPYLFEGRAADLPPALAKVPAARIVRQTDPAAPLSHYEYFRLCVSAHYLTCGTPVPTDVDNQIRHKLWPAGLPLETALQMAELVLESRQWDFRGLSARWNSGAAGTPWQSETLSGHLGEWFTLSSAAYCALGQYSAHGPAQPKRQALLEAIADEVHRHSEIFGSLWRAGDGLGCLRACASIAHNFGDLDRVMDMWELAVDDPLRLRFYKSATAALDAEGTLRHQGRLWVAGELYKSTVAHGSAMALENHRHFALRKPRVLRQRPAYLIPTGPFLDEWGAQVARGLGGDELVDVVEALLHGWQRLPRTVGYGRGLRGMLEVRSELDVGDARKVHAFRTVLDQPRDRFERTWSDSALRLMDEIPARL